MTRKPSIMDAHKWAPDYLYSEIGRVSELVEYAKGLGLIPKFSHVKYLAKLEAEATRRESDGDIK